MRLITNEESLVVGGGEYFWPIWQIEEFDSMFSEFSYGFDQISYGTNGKAVAKKVAPESERVTILAELKELYPKAEIKIEAKMEGTGSKVEKWSITVIVEGSTKK